VTATTPRYAQGDDAVRFGLAAGVAAYAMWGLFPIYIKAVASAPPLEILAHRILWSAPFGALVLFARSQWREVGAAFAAPRVLGMLAISAVAIGANWGIYVWAVASEQVLQASLGYYINPLMYVAAGVFILKERLRTAQIVAVALAGAGVATLSIGGGAFPWAAVALAILFTAYGYIRKTTPVGAMPGLFVETMLLAPFAAIFLFWLINSGGAVFASGDPGMDALLALAGPVTVIPLVCFAMAARRLRLSTLGFLQYIGPTGQFFLGLYFGEAFTVYHAVCFGLIWIALAIFSFDAVIANRADKLARAAAGAPPPPVSRPASGSPNNS
jgi:chloramphenicol-sensitive protein RarD